MSNYQTRFDEATTEARRLVTSNGSNIREIIPRFYGNDFDRLTKSISGLLEKIDKNNFDHPEYLAHSNGNVAEYAISIIQGVPSSLESGANHFVQTTLPLILFCEERLLKAVGHYYYKVKDIKDRQVKEIQKLAEESLGFYATSSNTKDKIQEDKKKADEIFSELNSIANNAKAVSAKIEEIRSFVSKLASGDGRGKSLESLKRTAEEKVSLIESILIKAGKASGDADKALAKLDGSSQLFDKSMSELADITSRANIVLGLSSQAGLANSYVQESSKLAFRSHVFTGILYSTSLATALIAAFYILPSLEHSLATNGGSLVTKALPVTLIRATILAPLVYVIYFTSRQISSLEVLRMDYAEKAAASLAYSGYKGEMSEDIGLLERLRGSLLLKFAEHPERLLRKRPVTDKIEVEGPGFKASSSSAETLVYKDVTPGTDA